MTLYLLSFMIGVFLSVFCYQKISRKIIDNAKPHKSLDSGEIVDMLFIYTKSINKFLNENRYISNMITIIGALLLDVVLISTIIHIIIYNTKFMWVIWSFFWMFMARLMMLHLSKFPIPEGMIWEDTKVLSLFTDFTIKNDFFFSGHVNCLTMLCLYWIYFEKIRLMTYLSLGSLVYTIVFLIITRAHYSADIYTGFITAIAMFYFQFHTIKIDNTIN